MRFVIYNTYQFDTVKMAGSDVMSVLENLVRPTLCQSIMKRPFPTCCSASTCLDSSITSSCSSTSETHVAATNCLCIEYLPTFHLDYARTVEVFDFYTNGIEHDLDEYDLY